jgi:hypothetical protein
MPSLRTVAGLIGNASGTTPFTTKWNWIRGVFDQQTRRKPLGFAADAVRYGIGTAVWGETGLWVGSRRADQDRLRCCRKLQQCWRRVVSGVVELG